MRTPPRAMRWTRSGPRSSLPDRMQRELTLHRAPELTLQGALELTLHRAPELTLQLQVSDEQIGAFPSVPIEQEVDCTEAAGKIGREDPAGIHSPREREIWRICQ